MYIPCSVATVLQSKRGKLLKFFELYSSPPIILFTHRNDIYHCYLHVNGLRCEFQLLYILTSQIIYDVIDVHNDANKLSAS